MTIQITTYCQTVNYVPKFIDNLGSTANSIIYQTSSKPSKMGINTTSPSGILDVRNNGSNSIQASLLLLKNEITGDQDANMTSDIEFKLLSYLVTQQSNPHARIGIKGTSDPYQNSEAGGNLYFSTANATYPANTLNERMRITPQGFVGIGTYNPISILDVHSGSVSTIATFSNSLTGVNLKIYGGSTSALIRNENNGKDFVFETQKISGTPNSNQLNMFNNGKVGIGTGAPTTHLDINNGTIKISGDASGAEDNARFVVDPGGSTAHRFLEFRNSNGVQMLVEGNGHLYVKEIEVTLSSPLGDFVFDDDYHLLSIYELEEFIGDNSHLPGVPSATEVSASGLNLGEMDNILLQKIEELTLYIIGQREQLEIIQDNVKSNKN
jgi:hypothetical protein